MKNKLPGVLIFLLTAAALPASELTYRLEYQICGSAVSRLLLIIPIRVYYDASAAVDLTARLQPDGSAAFTFSCIPRPAYILRTLGFSGRTLALLSADRDERDGTLLADQLLLQWRKEAPEFADHVKTVKKFPHRLTATGPQAFAFVRDNRGQYDNFMVGLEPQYKYYPAQTGIYFKVFPMLAELLKMLNHRFTPGRDDAPFAPFPEEWSGDELDFSANLNRVAALLEKIVKTKVKVQQKSPLRLLFHVAPGDSAELEICGESYPDAPLWKGFVIKEIIRRVRLRQVDRALLADELWMGIRNGKGQGGFFRLQLRMIESEEDKK